ncbi:hypothetical protein GWK47_020815 [Chionoecetes opilio]|uniref:Uncharacterized protein n=1 Tax=Chionoecetes opilio TaxID=41210 RepID=A0A8J4XP82_CHIOP|nr:hypothetical protein GWK47_020815 [Chionoecetes opilio]
MQCSKAVCRNRMQMTLVPDPASSTAFKTLLQADVLQSEIRACWDPKNELGVISPVRRDGMLSSGIAREGNGRKFFRPMQDPPLMYLLFPQFQDLSRRLALLPAIRGSMDRALRDLPYSQCTFQENLSARLSDTDWAAALCGDVDHNVATFTAILLAARDQHVPHRVYEAEPRDQPWFGFRCRLAAEDKYKAWVRLKRRPTQRNKALHRATCKAMTRTALLARNRWENYVRRKLASNQVDPKQWWSLVKERQGTVTQERIPPLITPAGDWVVKNQEKADLLATHFSRKMTTQDPERQPPRLPGSVTWAWTARTSGPVEEVRSALRGRLASGDLLFEAPEDPHRDGPASLTWATATLWNTFAVEWMSWP